MAALDRITVSVEHRDGAAVLVVGGEIDMANAPALETAVTEVLAEDPSSLIVDLLAVDFMGSVGLRILVAAQEKLGSSARLAVVANGPTTRRPIELTGLDQTLELYATLDEAVTALHTRSD